MSLATATLEGLNISHPEQHMSAIRTFQTITLLVKASPFTNQDIATIKDFNDKLGFDMVYFPGIEPGDANRYNVLPREVYHEAFSQILPPLERRAFLAGYAMTFLRLLMTGLSFSTSSGGVKLRIFGTLWARLGSHSAVLAIS